MRKTILKFVSAPVLSVILLLAAYPSFASERVADYDGWRISLYKGRYTRTALAQIIRRRTDFRHCWITVAGANRMLLNAGPVNIEGEINLGGYSGIQNHLEVNALWALRWKELPWNSVIDTSIAVGSGFSYAFGVPRIEARMHNPDPSRFLKYLSFELEAGIPGVSGWSVFTRIHHRSGVFGLIRTRQGANLIGFGIRGRY